MNFLHIRHICTEGCISKVHFLKTDDNETAKNKDMEDMALISNIRSDL